MPGLLVELLSEEIPARMQARAEADFAALLVDGCARRGLPVSDTRSYSGPRRLAFIANDVPQRSATSIEERKGPRVDAAGAAIAGFLKSAGLSSLDACHVVHDAKGGYYVARIEKPGKDAPSIVAEAVDETVRKFPWPKSMRWGSGSLKWVRPLHSIICLLDGNIVPLKVDGIASGNSTAGHRQECDKNTPRNRLLEIVSSESYAETLMHAKVVSAREERSTIILNGAHTAASDRGLVLVEDHGLLEENAGLVEWPVVLSGTFDESFLDVPGEILMTAMKVHQKYFSLRQPSGKLANRFILVANIDAPDGGRAIVRGHERVIRARLSDAKFFWEADRNQALRQLGGELNSVTFHQKLGTQLERVNRLVGLALSIARFVHAGEHSTRLAASLCKADLLSGTVGEFPELQGVIGRYMALAQGFDIEVADAIADHYKPQGRSDTVPRAPVSAAVALADKLDLLCGFWAIGEKPTGSKDPFALRRAALGIIRIVIENELRIPLRTLVESHSTAYAIDKVPITLDAAAIGDLLTFFTERLKVYLRDNGVRHDLIDAIYARAAQDDLLVTVRQVEALGSFLESSSGVSVLSLVRRALNILKIEEKRDSRGVEGSPAVKLMKLKHEKALSTAIRAAGRDATAALAAEDFKAAMASLATLREPIDAFFEHVTVNDADPAIRENRLRLLAQVRALTLQIADFSKIEG